MTPIAGREASSSAPSPPPGPSVVSRSRHASPALANGADRDEPQSGAAARAQPAQPERPTQPERPSTPSALTEPAKDAAEPSAAPKTPRSAKPAEFLTNPPSTPSSASRDYSSAAAYLSSPVRSARANHHSFAAGTMTPGRPGPLKFGQPSSPFKPSRSVSGSGSGSSSGGALASGQSNSKSPVNVPSSPLQSSFMTKEQASQIDDLARARTALVQALEQSEQYYKAAQQFRNLANHHIFQHKSSQVEADESERRFEVETSIQKREIEKLVVDIMGYDKAASTDQIRRKSKRTKQRVREMSDLVEAKNRQIAESQSQSREQEQLQQQYQQRELQHQHHQQQHQHQQRELQHQQQHQRHHQHHESDQQKHEPPLIAPFHSQTFVPPVAASTFAGTQFPASGHLPPIPIGYSPNTSPPGSIPLSVYQAAYAQGPPSQPASSPTPAQPAPPSVPLLVPKSPAQPEDTEMKMGSDSPAPTATASPVAPAPPRSSSKPQPPFGDDTADESKPRPPRIDTSAHETSHGPASAHNSAGPHAPSQPPASSTSTDTAFSDLELMASQTSINGFQHAKPGSAGQPSARGVPSIVPPPPPPGSASAPSSANPANPATYGTSPYSSPFYSPFSPYAVPPQHTRQLHFGSPEKRRRPSSSSTISAASEDDTLEDPTNTA